MRIKSRLAAGAAVGAVTFALVGVGAGMASANPAPQQGPAPSGQCAPPHGKPQGPPPSNMPKPPGNPPAGHPQCPHK
ncbi:hypothetical protein [Nocardia miyunensis]|uniref:hypothetical protein n=1 Tax=Nocardia miyunensis TaxID=282684 RepID=UPI000830540D|nr:hypothetical protein [Nocardia miyunensis]